MYFCTNLVGTLHWPQRQVRGRLAVVIEGTREDWPGGARTLTPRYPTREPNGTFWFGAELPAGDQVWFRIAEEAIGRMPEKTPRDRGARLVDALIVWIVPDHDAPGRKAGAILARRLQQLRPGVPVPVLFPLCHPSIRSRT